MVLDVTDDFFLFATCFYPDEEGKCYVTDLLELEKGFYQNNIVILSI